LAANSDAELAQELLSNPAPLADEEYDDYEPSKPVWLALPAGLSAGFLPLRRNGWFGVVITIFFLLSFISFFFGWGEWLIFGLIDAFATKA